MEEKKRIFIADDDEAALVSLRKLLELSGFDVEAVREAKDIVARIKSFKPNLLLLDLLMPHLGGFEICQMLNNDKETQGIPIIIISGLSGYADIKSAYKLGVVGYVTKPYDFKKLLEEINKTIRYKEAKLE
ncbi:MAG: response regulator [Candidatus Omnitrophica bacterium]|nr:response regulator [Candidatus Omnitrophota bacterium]